MAAFTTTSAAPTRSAIEQLLRLLNPENAHPSPFAMTTGKSKGEGVATQVFPRFDLLFPGEPESVDIEMQDYFIRGQRGGHCRLGWIAIINSRGEIILDCFVRYEWDGGISIISFPPSRYGVWKERLWERNGAVDGKVVEQWCAAIFKDRDVVLHDGRNDRRAFYHVDFFAGARNIFNTQAIYSSYQPDGTPGLGNLTRWVLHIDIQQNGDDGAGHTPVEDATATMALFLHSRPYNRSAALAKFEALSATEKAAYLATGPVILRHHYQGNKIPSTRNAPASQRGAYRGSNSQASSKRGQPPHLRGRPDTREGQTSSYTTTLSRQDSVISSRAAQESQKTHAIITAQGTVVKTSEVANFSKTLPLREGTAPGRGGYAGRGRGSGRARGRGGIE